MKFTELNLNKNLQDAIRKAGYKEPSPIQEKAIPAAMSGRDLIACAQTGTGKTAAFALPILNRLEKASYGYIRALVLTPTRELAIQNFDNFKKYGRYMNLRTVCIYGGAKERPQIMQLHRGCDILVATPGRLIDYMDRGIVSLEGIEIFVLDEADRMLDMGFIHDIRKIAAATPEKRQTLLFSATMPRPIERLAQELIHDPESIKVAPTTSPAETVDQKICFLKKEDKKHALSAFLKQADVRKAIVFTRTKHGADRLVKDLGKENIESIAIHGDKTQGQRQSALERFRGGKINVLVATDVAARGIDIRGVTHVYNYDLPEESESYIHRIGRAGRAGASGEAVSLCDSEEMGLLADIEHMMGKEIPELKTDWSVELERRARGDRRRHSHRAGSGRRPSGHRSYGRGAHSERSGSFHRSGDGARAERSEGFRRDGDKTRSERSEGFRRDRSRAEAVRSGDRASYSRKRSSRRPAGRREDVKAS